MDLLKSAGLIFGAIIAFYCGYTIIVTLQHVIPTFWN